MGWGRGVRSRRRVRDGGGVIVVDGVMGMGVGIGALVGGRIMWSRLFALVWSGLEGSSWSSLQTNKQTNVLYDLMNMGYRVWMVTRI